MGDLLTNWHGHDNSAAFALAFSFDLSSLVMLVVFGGIALGIIVAKVAMVVMIALLIVATVASLWISVRRNGFGGDPPRMRGVPSDPRGSAPAVGSFLIPGSEPRAAG